MKSHRGLTPEQIDRHMRNHCRSGNYRLNPYQVIEIVERIDAGEQSKRVAKAFGTSDVNVSHIDLGQTWDWLTGRSAWRTSKKHVTPAMVEDIYRRVIERGERGRDVARNTGVDESHVSQIAGGKKHARITAKLNIAPPKGRSLHSPLTDDDALAIFNARRQGRALASIAADFGVHASTVWRIVTNKCKHWALVTAAA